MEVKILQYNCQRSYAVMSELGKVLYERGVNVAILQEPMFSKGRVIGLPAGMRVFASASGNSAIVVCDPSIDCMVMKVRKNMSGVCVSEWWLWGYVCRNNVCPAQSACRAI